MNDETKQRAVEAIEQRDDISSEQIVETVLKAIREPANNTLERVDYDGVLSNKNIFMKIIDEILK